MVFQKLRNKMKKKLHNNRGDSIAEVLVALLISSLALVMLASMITSSARMITTSKAKLNDYYRETEALCTYAQTSGASSHITIKSSDTITVSYKDASDNTHTKDYNVAKSCVNTEFSNTPVVSFKK